MPAARQAHTLPSGCPKPLQGPGPGRSRRLSPGTWSGARGWAAAGRRRHRPAREASESAASCRPGSRPGMCRKSARPGLAWWWGVPGPGYLETCLHWGCRLPPKFWGGGWWMNTLSLGVPCGVGDGSFARLLHTKLGLCFLWQPHGCRWGAGAKMVQFVPCLGVTPFPEPGPPKEG